MSKWTYFTDNEFQGLDMELCAMLDMARSKAGIPFRLTATTQGTHVAHSAHYKGLAVDIGLGHIGEGFDRDHARFRIVKALFDVGFKRVETAPLHVHADIAGPPDYMEEILMHGVDG